MKLSIYSTVSFGTPGRGAGSYDHSDEYREFAVYSGISLSGLGGAYYGASVDNPYIAIPSAIVCILTSPWLLQGTVVAILETPDKISNFFDSIARKKRKKRELAAQAELTDLVE